MKLFAQLHCANFTKDTKSQANNIRVVALEINPDSVGGHHEKLRFFMEELGEAYTNKMY